MRNWGVRIHAPFSPVVAQVLLLKELVRAIRTRFNAAFEKLRATQNNGCNVTVVKEAMTLLGRPVGPVRAPGTPRLGERDREALRRIVDGWGLRPAA